MPTKNLSKVTYVMTCCLMVLGSQAYAQNFADGNTSDDPAVQSDQLLKPAESEKDLKPGEVPLTVDAIQAMVNQLPEGTPQSKTAPINGFDPLKYTLGPEDVVEIAVMRHPEFSGTYPIDKEGKLQYKFVGDLKVTGMTKVELEDKIREVISKFIISPEINVTITEYKSKVFYVLGEVGAPGKYYMRSETVSVRDAVVMAGLPTQAAAMRKSQIITPAQAGGVIQMVDIYSLLYGGNLKKNLMLKPGDFLYVPSTVMAKVFRVISPVSNVVGVASSPATAASSGKTSAQDLAK